MLIHLPSGRIEMEKECAEKTVYSTEMPLLNWREPFSNFEIEKLSKSKSNGGNFEVAK